MSEKVHWEVIGLACGQGMAGGSGLKGMVWACWGSHARRNEHIQVHLGCPAPCGLWQRAGPCVRAALTRAPKSASLWVNVWVSNRLSGVAVWHQPSERPPETPRVLCVIPLATSDSECSCSRGWVAGRWSHGEKWVCSSRSLRHQNEALGLCGWRLEPCQALA